MPVPKRGVVPSGPGASSSAGAEEEAPMDRSTGSNGERSERAEGRSAGLSGNSPVGPAAFGGAAAGSSRSDSCLGEAGNPPVGASSSETLDHEVDDSLTDGKPWPSASSPGIFGSGPVVSS